MNPSYEHLMEAFGGGANRHLEVLTRMEGLHALNNFCMSGLDQIRILHPGHGAA